MTTLKDLNTTLRWISVWLFLSLMLDFQKAVTSYILISFFNSAGGQ